MRFADVAIPSPLSTAFTYSVKDDVEVEPGTRVMVEFRRKDAVGLVMRLRDSAPEGVDSGRIKPVKAKLDEVPALSPQLLKLVEWMSGYYCAPIGEAFRAALPSRLTSLKAPKTTRPVQPMEIHPIEEPAFELNAAQGEALEGILEAVRRGSSDTFLLHGVTGSGKTEVYLRLFEKLAQDGRQGLLLVPEIGLTPQLAGRAAARFGNRIAVYHSALTDAQRHDQWMRAKRGEIDVVIGTRSALFAPLPNLGAIVVDEEHASSYKQDEGFAYNGRDSAIMRAHIEGAVAVLGSATPSLESMANARSGKYSLCELPLRTGTAVMPSIEVVDMRAKRGAKSNDRGFCSLSPRLHSALGETLKKNEQALLFIGRRGFASAVHCETCGELIRCPNCDISLTVHAGPSSDHLACHYCDYRTPCPEGCPSCSATEITPVGHGTQRLEGEIRDFFPNARIARLDSDMAASRKERHRILGDMRKGRIDILVGTQMVTKGHDFPNVTLVGVVSADQSLALPDFRSAERTFQLVTQVAGRAGRAERPGLVIVQSFQPEHPSIRTAANNDVAGFVEEELAFREKAGYPPFRRLALVRVSSLKRDQAKGAARRAGEIMGKEANEGIEILGPAPAGIEKLRSRWRWQLLVKARSAPALAKFLSEVRPRLASANPRGVRLAIDVDPTNLL